MSSAAVRTGALALALASAHSLRAQAPIVLEPPSGEAGASFLHSQTDVGAIGLRQRTWTQWVRLGLAGALFDPGLVRLQLQARPLLTQSTYRMPADSAGGTYNFEGRASLKLLSARALRAGVEGERTSDIYTGLLGRTAELRESAWRAVVEEVDPILPTAVRYEDLSRKAAWSMESGQPAFRLDERMRTFVAHARNTKTGVELQRVEYRERLQDLGFVLRLASLDHSLQWGKGSNLRSSGLYIDRTELTSFSRSSWQELLHLQHLSRLSTDWQYALSRQQGTVGRSEERRGGARATWRPVSAVGLELEGLSQSISTDAGRQRFTRAFPTLRLDIPLIRKIRLRASLSTGYEWHEQVSVGDVLVDVLQERHVADASGRLRLNQPFAVGEGLVVTSADGEELYREGFDYRVVAVGPFVDILVLPTGRILEGTALVVDYRVQLMPSAASDAWTRSAETRLLAGPLELYQRRYRQEGLNPLPPGTLPMLRDWDQSAVGATFALSGRVLSLGGGAERSRDRSDLYDGSSEQANGSFGVHAAGVSAVASSSWTRVYNTTNPYRLLRSELRAERSFSAALRLSAFASQWRLQSDGRSQDFRGGGATLDWRWGQTTVQGRLDRVRLANGPLGTTTRAFLSVLRRFGP